MYYYIETKAIIKCNSIKYECYLIEMALFVARARVKLINPAKEVLVFSFFLE